MGELRDWGNRPSKFLKLSDGESVEGVYSGYEFGEYRGTPNVKYKVIIDGEIKILTSSSKDLSGCMDSIAKGSVIRITRLGLEGKTKYGVEVLSTPKEAVAPQAKEPAQKPAEKEGVDDINAKLNSQTAPSDDDVAF